MLRCMGLIEAALWGALGGIAICGLDFWKAVRQHRKLPWHVGSSSLGSAPALVLPGESHLPAPGPLAYGIAETIRTGVGAGLAAAAAASPPQIVTPWLAVLVGGAAFPFLEKITGLVPLMMQMGRTAVIASIEQQQQTQTGASGPTGPDPTSPGITQDLPSTGQQQGQPSSPQGGV